MPSRNVDRRAVGAQLALQNLAIGRLAPARCSGVEHVASAVAGLASGGGDHKARDNRVQPNTAADRTEPSQLHFPIETRPSIATRAAKMRLRRIAFFGAAARLASGRNGKVDMRYVSTRGEAPVLGFSDALLAGLARDGGLYVPAEWPHFSAAEIRAMRGLSYAELAIRVLTPFLGGEIGGATFRADRARGLCQLQPRGRLPAGADRTPTASCSSCSTARRWPSRTWRCSCSRG